MTPAFTIVICTKDRPLELEKCLSAGRLLDYSDFEILAVDNAPTDAQARDLARRFGARYIVEPLVGLSRARNRGAFEARTELIAYIDDDAIPEKYWLSALANEF